MHPLFVRLNHQFQRLTEPPSSITDFGHRQVFRLVQSIVIVFIPIAIIAGSLSLIFSPHESVEIQTMLLVRVIIPTVMLMLATLVGRYLGYWGAATVIYVVGYSIIAMIVIAEAPDFFDTIYLIIMPILATMMFGTRVVAGVVVAQLSVVFAIVLLVRPDNSGKLLSFQLVLNLVILFSTYYRNLLETDRNRQLAESEAFLRLITDQLPVSVWITDKKLSRGVSFGYIQDVEDVATIPNPKSLQAYRRALDGDSAQFEDHKHDRYLQYRVEPMRDENGEIIGTLSVASDITEQKVIQQQALQLELERNRVEILSKFIEHSSHDLRTPLSNINTYLYLLDNSVETEKQHHYIHIIREQSERLQGLINNMLMLQRLELEPDFEFSSMSLKSLLDGLETAYRPRIEGKQIVFDYTPPDDGIVVKVTEKYLFAALTRILDNAIQFTAEGGTINLFVTHALSEVTISIKDTGIGITESQLPHIFDIFYRGDDSRPAVRGDNGLGLTIARRIVSVHQGKITVDSRVDQGTTVNITLPMFPIQQRV